MHSAYILWSPEGRKFYIGVTEDVAARLIQHNEGVSTWTRRFAGTWQLVWSQECVTLGEARKMELHLKAQKRGIGFFSFTGLNPSLYPKSGS